MRETMSSTPWHRRDLGFMELNIPRVIDGKTVFVRERVSLRRILPFWYHWHVKAAWRDLRLKMRMRRVSRQMREEAIKRCHGTR